MECRNRLLGRKGKMPDLHIQRKSECSSKRDFFSSFDGAGKGGGTFFAILAIASSSSFSVPFHLAPFSAKSGARTNGGRRRYDDGKVVRRKLVAGKMLNLVMGRFVRYFRLSRLCPEN